MHIVSIFLHFFIYIYPDDCLKLSSQSSFFYFKAGVHLGEYSCILSSLPQTRESRAVKKV